MATVTCVESELEVEGKNRLSKYKSMETDDIRLITHPGTPAALKSEASRTARRT